MKESFTKRNGRRGADDVISAQQSTKPTAIPRCRVKTIGVLLLVLGGMRP